MRITVRFPLGVYHAQSPSSAEEPEWPPHPVRLIGAFVAAAHSPGRLRTAERSLERDLLLLKRLCEAPAPLIRAQIAAPAVGADEHAVAELRGATRWAPRNYFTGGRRDQAAVQKVGVASGDRPIHFDWPELELNHSEHQGLVSLARDVTFLGTSRSPAIVEVHTDASEELEPAFRPLGRKRPAAGTRINIRVPDAGTIEVFDRRHMARRSLKNRVESATAAVPGIRPGREEQYVHSSELTASTSVIDPKWWGEMVVLAIDRVSSEVVPRAPAAYLLARAVRTALLGAYDSAGTIAEAPAILRGRGADPHCAFLPLADVWHGRSSGEIKGVAVLLPSVERAADVPRQRAAVEQGLASLVQRTDREGQRFVQIPGSGRIWLKQPDPREAALKTLLRHTYSASATSWVSVTPVVHARWRKGPQETLLDQVGRDCSHVGLPAPASVEALRGPALPGAASRPVSMNRVPPEWRKSLGGPANHLRITFESPVVGPLLLGRARHFGLGLFVPE